MKYSSQNSIIIKPPQSVSIAAPPLNSMRIEFGFATPLIIEAREMTRTHISKIASIISPLTHIRGSCMHRYMQQHSPTLAQREAGEVHQQQHNASVAAVSDNGLRAPRGSENVITEGLILRWLYASALESSIFRWNGKNILDGCSEPIRPRDVSISLFAIDHMTRWPTLYICAQTARAILSLHEILCSGLLVCSLSGLYIFASCVVVCSGAACGLLYTNFINLFIDL